MRRWQQFGALLVLAVLYGCGGGGGGTAPAASGFTVSGTGAVSAGLTADSDVNDPDAPYASNDSAASAQAAVSPGTIVGYASKTGFGMSGSRFAASADTFDSYRVTLTAGQLVSLDVSGWDSLTPAAVDLDLFLYDSGQTLVASSEGTGAVEELTAPASGDYFLVVAAIAGAGNYRLTLGTAAGVASRDRLSRFDDFVAGELVVTPRAAAGATAALATTQGTLAAGGRDGQPLLVRLSDRVTAASAALPNDPWNGRLLTPAAAAKAATITAVKTLRAAPEIATAAPNYRRTPCALPDDPLYRYQWHYPMIHLPEAWAVSDGTRSGTPVIVAVIDTGVVLAHPDLQGQLVAGYDFIRDPATALDGTGIDSDPDDPGDQNLQGGSSWHGTHVAGTVAARSNNTLGVAGAAGGARIMPLRVLGKDGGTSYDTIQALRYAAGLSNDSGTLPPQRADVINLSLSGGGFDQAEADAVTAARNAGVIVVAAAGNEKSSAAAYPAAYPGVVAVSAVTIDGRLTSYSNTGPAIDVAAPGGDFGSDVNRDGYSDEVLSTTVLENDGSKSFGYKFMAGTSMATPHVAAVAALMKAVAPALTPAQFDALLANGDLSDDLGPAGRDDAYGYGLIDAFKAVGAAQALAGGTLPPILSAAPVRLDFGATAQDLIVSVSNIGGGTLAVSGWSTGVSWLTVVPVTTAADGLGDYRLVVDRSTLLPGTHGATVTFTSSAGSCSVPVTVDVVSTAASGNGGRLYFLLLDGQTQALKYWDAVNPLGGSYPFAFGGVTAGSYWLIAGSDFNNDGYICDPGENCGIWPLLGDPQLLTVSGARNDLVLAVSAPVNFHAGAAGPPPASRGYGRRPAIATTEAP